MAQAFRWMNNQIKTRPMAWGMAITVVKTSAADLIAQKVIERRERVDFKRNAIFTMFGFVYLGGFQFALYNHILPRMFPGTGTRVVMKRLFVDQAIHHPIMYFPAFYGIKTVMQNDSFEKGFTNYKHDLPENMIALWKVWVPSMFVCFAFVPAHMRIPYVSGVSFFWTTILSVMQSRFDSTRTTATTSTTLTTTDNNNNNNSNTHTTTTTTTPADNYTTTDTITGGSGFDTTGNTHSSDTTTLTAPTPLTHPHTAGSTPAPTTEAPVAPTASSSGS
eukprot:TRINITY_DN2932_c0_g1_i1.p1 TRINITY_DN2932_c0_g1~~TRINITY_DN2932_c0_g1_i1.p1  ORF type:complete len:276 (-),score=67.96 TRINITY_DN2932_c0_g1_i1:10-837(-)